MELALGVELQEFLTEGRRLFPQPLFILKM